jgi:putative ABC transport system substrate-binding protein
MRRRLVIGILGACALVWPLLAHAQQRELPVVGFLNSGSPDSFAYLATAFRRGLTEAGIREGRDAAIEYRWADGHFERLPMLAAALVERHAAVIAEGGGPPALLAARQATSTIPIVFVTGIDPVADGVVESFNRPGGNATGAYMFTPDIDAKRLALLHELVPTATTIAALLPAGYAAAEIQLRKVSAAAEVIGQHIRPFRADDDGDIDAAFAAMAKNRADAVLVAASPLFNDRRAKVVALANRYRIPAIYEFPAFVKAGGLMSYGTDITEAYRQAGIYVGRILRGAKPSELPVVQSSKFHLVVNLKTAGALGIVVPQSILVRADEVIE